MKKIIKIAVCLLFAVINLNVIAQDSISNKSNLIVKSFIVYEKENRKFIEWEMDENFKSNFWKVQWSRDGKQFTTIALVLGENPARAGNNFQYKEKIDQAKYRKVYYRLCHVDTYGNEFFSEIISTAK
jgi:hypothetical protein